MPEQTPQVDIARQYRDTMDSVHLIERMVDPDNKNHGVSEEDFKDTIKRNVEHLQIMAGKDFFTKEQVAEFQAGIKKGNDYLAK